MGWMILTLLLGQNPPPPQTPAPRVPVGEAPVRDAKPRAGTGVIAGRVLAADSGLPLRRTIVTLMSTVTFAKNPLTGASVGSRSVATDGEGKFEFAGLPAATYRLRAAPPPQRQAYMPGVYGGRGARSVGAPIELKDDAQVRNADIVLGRGGAIVGRVVDEFGEPMALVSVYAAMRVPGRAPERRGGGSIQTDDLGRYRIFGLEAGEYCVAVEGRSMGGPQVEGETEGYLTTYFPSTLAEAQAGRVRVEAGGETPGIDIQLVRTRTYRISGMVVDSQGRPIRASPELVYQTFGGGASGTMLPVDASGKFTSRDITPGDYRLVVRPYDVSPSNTPSGSPPPGSRRPEFANMPITVASDMEDIVVMTGPGLSITGQVVFAEQPPPATPGLRIITYIPERTVAIGPPPAAAVEKDLHFTLNDIFGPLLIRPIGLPPGHAVKAVMLGSTDISDTATEFRADDNRRLQIILTSRVAALEGVVTGDGGGPADATLLLFPDERESWNSNSIRVRTVNVRNGKFNLPALLPGTYYAVAVPPDSVTVVDMGPEFYEPFTKTATTVVLAEGEKRTIELRIAMPLEK